MTGRVPAAVLFSTSTRQALADRAQATGETYRFKGAAGRERIWLKGHHAYLAANGASAWLTRLLIRHDMLDDAEIDEALLRRYRVLIIPSCFALEAHAIDAIVAWVSAGGRVLSSGPTNLPPGIFGLAQLTEIIPSDFTAWAWNEQSRFGIQDTWTSPLISGYRGHPAMRATASRGRVLADLVSVSTSGIVTAHEPPNAGVVMTENTAFVGNAVFELIGGALQGHLNVEPFRHWANATHWGDVLALMLRNLLWQLDEECLTWRLRPFGTYSGSVSLRHDVHGPLDASFIDYEVRNLIPATYDIENPRISGSMSNELAGIWVQRTRGIDFIEQALHHDSTVGEQAEGVTGTGIFDQVSQSTQTLGFRSTTIGRHGGRHAHPETIDAMEYLYDQAPEILGACTFCFYEMLEYGGDAGTSDEQWQPTYTSDIRLTISASGFWGLFHPVVTTASEWRRLRGWDRTHDVDCSFDLIDRVLGGVASTGPTDDWLSDGIYSLQYHPEYADEPGKNNGTGTLSNLKYAIHRAIRCNYWLATREDLYRRMTDYEAMRLEIDPADDLVIVTNESPRRSTGLSLEFPNPINEAWLGSIQLIRIYRDRILTLPPLDPGGRAEVRLGARPHASSIRVSQPDQVGLEVLSATHHQGPERTDIRVRFLGHQRLRIDGVTLGQNYEIRIDGRRTDTRTPRTFADIQRTLASATGDIEPLAFIDVALAGNPLSYREVSVSITPVVT